MSPTISPTQSQEFEALRTFLLSILPDGVQVFQAQINRVSEPSVSDFVVMTPLRRPRLSTNVDMSADVKFIGSMDGNLLNVTSVAFGTVLTGSQVLGIGVAANTRIGVQLNGTSGGVGQYKLSPSQTLSNQILSSGQLSIMQPTQWEVQLDVHGPDSADNAQIISTLFRDGYATENFSDLVSPLYADDPQQIPFINGEDQYENRWVINAVMQVNPVVAVPQQYADTIDITLQNVEATFPP